MIRHQVESLAEAGVTDIVLAVNYRPDMMAAALKKVGVTSMILCNKYPGLTDNG